MKTIVSAFEEGMKKTPSFGQLTQLGTSQMLEEEKIDQKFLVKNLFEESSRFIQRIGFGFVSSPICLFVLDRLLIENNDQLRC